MSEMQLPEAAELSGLTDEEFRKILAGVVDITYEDRKRNQILTYKPVSQKAQDFHDSKARVNALGGGNGSGKSDTALVELVMCATGIFPHSQRHLIEQKFKGPIQCRLVVESLTTTLETIILPKLMWWHWTGVDKAGGERGHWGWIPQTSLVDNDWQRSWSAKLRLLRLVCRDPYNPEKILGESTIQCMSFDQDPADFASGDFHIVIHDEPPSLPIWRENEARTMRVDGRMLLAMTWPDDPSINVDWLYDEVYEPGRSGSDPNIRWGELWSTENKNLKQEAVAAQAGKWSNEITAVRIYGRPIRFSNRIHPDFTEDEKIWCLKCDKAVIAVPLEHKDGIGCPNCGSENLPAFKHVDDFDAETTWPTVFLIDPHPRRPHCLMWVQISPQDDWFQVAESEIDGDCVDVKRECDRVEQMLSLHVAQRITDPNMGASPASSQRVNGRPLTWQDEFRSAGLNLDLGQDAEVGRARVNTMLKVDERTQQPRIKVHSRCRKTIYQFTRYSWADYSKNIDRDPKQVPKDMHSDFPTLWKYLANSDPNFRFLKAGAPVIQRPGKRKGAY